MRKEREIIEEIEKIEATIKSGILGIQRTKCAEAKIDILRWVISSNGDTPTTNDLLKNILYEIKKLTGNRVP